MESKKLFDAKHFFEKKGYMIDWKNLEKQNKHIRFKQVEERSLKDLFSNNKKYNEKILKEFLAEGHRRVSSPFLVIFMSLAAAFTILLGKEKNSNTTKRISLLSIIIVSIQAIYIVAINTCVI